jgi:hypothetical protein
VNNHWASVKDDPVLKAQFLERQKLRYKAATKDPKKREHLRALWRKAAKKRARRRRVVEVESIDPKVAAELRQKWADRF